MVHCDWSLHGARLRSEKPKWLRELRWDPLIEPLREEKKPGQGGGAPKVPDRKAYLGNKQPRGGRTRRFQHKGSAWAAAAGREDINAREEKEGPMVGQYNVHYDCVLPRAPNCTINAPTHVSRKHLQDQEAGGGVAGAASPSPRSKASRGAAASEEDHQTPSKRGEKQAATVSAGEPNAAEEDDVLLEGVDESSPKSARRPGGAKGGHADARAKSATPGGMTLAGGMTPCSNPGQEAVWGHSPAANFHSLAPRPMSVGARANSPWEPGDVLDAGVLSTTPRAPAFRFPQNTVSKSTGRASRGTPGAHYAVSYTRLSSERRTASGVPFARQADRNALTGSRAGSGGGQPIGYWDRMMMGMTNERMRVHGDDAAVRPGQRLENKQVPGKYIQQGGDFGSRTGREVLNSFDVERSGVRDLSDAPAPPGAESAAGKQFTPRADTWYAWRNEVPQPFGMAKSSLVSGPVRDGRGRPKKAGAMAAISALQECQRVTEWFEFRVADSGPPAKGLELV